MSTYETLVFIHVVAAAVWVGAAVLGAALGLQAVGSRDGDQIAAYARQGRIVGLVTGVASLVLIGFGVWAALDADIDFGLTWMSVGLTAWLVAFLLAAVFYGPYAARIRAAIADEGPGSGRVARLLRTRLAVAGVEIAVLIAGIWAMVDKPA